MRNTILTALAALNKKKADEEAKDGGFSLIELIVVVAILGILVAVAIPVYGNIQQTARDNAADTACASAVAQAAANAASGTAAATAATDAGTRHSSAGKFTVTVSVPASTTTTFTGSVAGASGYTLTGSPRTC